MTFTGLPVAGVGAAMALQRAAEQQRADLIVLGSSHRGAVGRVLVGSVTEETLHGAPCPVAVAPVGFHRSPKDPRLGEIAVAYDDERRPTPHCVWPASSPQRQAPTCG